MAITKVSDGTLRKYDLGGGRWRWRGSFYVWFDDGTRKQYSKLLGECEPPTDEERETMAKKRTPAPSGKGSSNAKKEFAKFKADKLEDVEAEEAEKALPDPARYTPAEFVRWYVDKRKNVGSSTHYGYESTINNQLDAQIYPMLKKPVSTLSTTDVIAWLDAMEEAEVGAHAREKSLARLSAAYNWAIKADILTTNPCAAAGKPKVVRRRPNPLDERSVAKLNMALDALPDTEANADFAFLVRLALFTGMRRGELCGLRWQDVDGWQDDSFSGYIHVRNAAAHGKRGEVFLKDCPKNGDRRDVDINADIRGLLRERKAQQLEERVALGLGGDLSEVFVAGSAESIKPPSPNSVSRRWRTFSIEAGIFGVSGERAHLHDLRHTFCTRLLVSEWDPATVASLAGHRDPTITVRLYTAFLPSKNAKAMRSMEGKFTARASSADVLPFDSKVG